MPDLRPYKKYIQPILRLRLLIRRAALFFLHADDRSEKKKVLYYCWIALLRAVGLNPKAEPEWTLRLGGIQLYFNSRFAELVTYKGIFVNRIYERSPGFIVRGSQTVFDVGANIGLYTIQAGRRLKGGAIFAFEPNPSVYSKLVKNIEANRLQNVRSFPCAVGDRPGRAVMTVEEGRTTGGRIARNGETAGERIEVEVVTLDAIVEKFRVPRIDLLKIDVEGHENEVLAGARKTLPLTRRIIMEHHGRELLDRARRFLADFGFNELFEYRRNVYFIRTTPGDGDTHEAA